MEMKEIEKTFSELTKYSEIVTYTQYKATVNDLIINNLMNTIPDINYKCSRTLEKNIELEYENNYFILYFIRYSKTNKSFD